MPRPHDETFVVTRRTSSPIPGDPFQSPNPDESFIKQKGYTPSEDENVLYTFESAHNGDKLGVQMNDNGTFTFGTWDDDGEWIEIRFADVCEVGPHCRVHRSRQLNQYDEQLWNF